MKKLKIGIIGYGKMGKIRHKAIEKSGQAEVIVIFDPNPIVPVNHKIKVASSAEKVLNQEIDAVFICTPNNFIKPLTVSALQKGIHVFAEKPPGINLEEALEMQSVEQRLNDKVLMFGFNHRHHGSVAKMKEIIEEESLGKILWMRGRYGKEVDENYLKDWRVNPMESGGGIMLDQGIHMLDLFLYLGGEFDEVKSFVSNLYWKIPGIEDNVFAIFKNNKSGLCASLHSTMTQWRHLFSLELFLEKGSLILNGLKTSSGAYGEEILTIRKNGYPFVAGRSNEEEQINFKEDFSWDSEIAHFFYSIENNLKPEIGNSTDAVKLMSTIKKIYEN
jgi:1,5-anhydro-D-fructose reductase (1,5-anhydro-D-mannitol-forming)